MGFVSVKVHGSWLLRIRLIKCCLLVIPPRPHLYLKLAYNIILLVYLALISRWRFAFNYNVIYDHLHDQLSRIIDLVNFVALVVGHFIIGLELIWRNRSSNIDQQFLQIGFMLRERIGQKVTLRPIRAYGNIIYSFLFLRVVVLFGMTMYNFIVTNTSLLLICNLYSELVLILRCSEFTLHSAYILAIYQELHKISLDLISELESAEFKLGSNSRLFVEQLHTMQDLHQLLWKTQRDVEQNFTKSLIVITFKNFVDTSVMPYWVYLERHRLSTYAMQSWCITEEFGKLLELCISCWFCTQCERLQRNFRSLFHGISSDRRNSQLNAAILQISTQLGQENCHFSVGGLYTINNEMLGKFLFGMVSYIFIFIQFRNTFAGNSSDVSAEESMLLSLNQSLFT